MKKFSRRIILNIALCLLGVLLIGSISCEHAYGLVSIPEKVKIGIYYGQNAAPNVSLSSTGGLELGYYEGNSFIGLMQFNQNDGIYIRKDNHYTNAIANEFASKQEAEAFIYSLPELIDDPYIAYDNGWKVCAGLYTTHDKVQEAHSAIQQDLPNTQLKILPLDNKRVQIANKDGKVIFMYNTNNFPCYFKSPNIIQLNGKNFRGDISIQRYADSDLTVINELSLTEYLYGVVPREVSGSWPIEAQKAQAVAARNYTILNLNKHAQHGFDLCASTHCQVYGGYDSEHPRSSQAVDETKDRVLTYNGKLVNTFYHSNSGGHTENAENVWNYPLDHIKGVADPYSIGSPNDKWTKVYTKQEIEGILASQGISVGELKDISIQEVSQNGRVLKLLINGSAGEKILEKEKIRAVFGYNDIKSTWFEIVKDSKGQSSLNALGNSAMPPKSIDINNKYIVTASGYSENNSLKGLFIYNGNQYIKVSDSPSIPSSQYIFNGKGWGHGLGMSQWGAKKMSEEGFDYKQILTHYYTGTKVE